MPYSIHEPSPTYPSTFSFGRGGAGNRTRPAPPTALPTTTTTTTTSHQTTTKPNFSTGRGGAGNMKTPSRDDRAMFRFDEELEQERKTDAVPVYHIGRGGQGNKVQEGEGCGAGRRRESDSSCWSGSSRGEGAKRASLEWVRGLAAAAGAGGRKG